MIEKPGGYTNKILVIDLATSSVEERQTGEELMKDYLGGRGLATRLFCDFVPPKAEPLGEENAIVIATSPISATKTPTAGRGHLVFKSPLTGTIGSSNSGGEWGAYLKMAGYDALVITGRAKHPVVLFIDGDKSDLSDRVAFIDARNVWGRDVHATSDSLLNTPERKGARGLFIGQAGENLVRFAAVMNEKNRAYGRGGPGAVFGSKNLKGIIVCGSHKTTVADEAVFDAGLKHAHYKMRAAPGTKRILRELGTAGLVNLINWIDMLPHRNFIDTTHKQADLDRICGEAIADTILLKPVGCYRCPMMCGRRTQVGNYSGEGPEYETVVLLGPVLDIYDLPAITTLNYLANEFGMDTISLGGTLSAAMECAEHGLLPARVIGNHKLRFGNIDGLHDIVRQTAFREGIGDLIAEGSLRLTTECGAPQFAMTVKGLEIPAYDPRASYTQSLGYMTSPTGACHLRGGYAVSLAFFGGSKEIPRFSVRQSPMAAHNVQNLGIIQDSAGICRFTGYAFGIDVIARLLTGATGLDFSVEQLEIIAQRIATLERLFNNAAGFTAEDDTLPMRFQTEPIFTDGAERVVSAEHIRTLRKAYYEIRNWDENGNPAPETLQKLSL
ncbi:MAG: aldehyde ferredoxin oxidoreductase family protein [bacterium]